PEKEESGFGGTGRGRHRAGAAPGGGGTGRGRHRAGAAPGGSAAVLSPQDTVERLLRLHFRDDRTRVNGDALRLTAELLKVFVRGERGAWCVRPAAGARYRLEGTVTSKHKLLALCYKFVLTKKHQ
uniref:Centromere protein X n=1 Tax=Anas platyrhynchos TaxID=8839 RepID=A0A8B9R1T6_ANAPL